VAGHVPVARKRHRQGLERPHRHAGPEADAEGVAADDAPGVLRLSPDTRSDPAEQPSQPASAVGSASRRACSGART
jgi:hypothetical protein